MGGSGSGTWYRYETKISIDQMMRIDIRYLKKHGMLKTGRYPLAWALSNGAEFGQVSLGVIEKKGVVVSFNWQSDSTGLLTQYNIPIRFSQSACSYGGFRQWLNCPRCRRRVSIVALYPPVIACRHCLNLTYSSQNERPMYRALRRRNKIGDRIGISSPFDAGSTSKPKGMHWETFNRLICEYEFEDELAVASFMIRH